MASRPDAGAVSFLLRFLAAYRLLFYLGGLLAMSVPLVAAWVFGYEASESVRTAVVGVCFAAIVLTYVAERRVGLDHVDPVTGSPREGYSRRARASVVLAIAGVAVGVYLLLADDLAMGLLFLAGALLFFQLAYREERADGDGTGG